LAGRFREAAARHAVWGTFHLGIYSYLFHRIWLSEGRAEECPEFICAHPVARRARRPVSSRSHPFDFYHANELGAVHSILGAIVVAREQLTDEQLSWLDLELSKVQEMLSRMLPLLQGGHGKSVQVLHTSLPIFCAIPEGVKMLNGTSMHPFIITI
jgi:hypothetical protein